jgi:hypothetical protein
VRWHEPDDARLSRPALCRARGEIPRACSAIAAGDDPYLEGLPLGGDASARQPAAQRLVDDLAEGPPGPARFRLELGRHSSSRVSVVRMS